MSRSPPFGRSRSPEAEEKARMEQALRQVAPGEQIAKLMGLAENRECADCTAAAPQWASWNLGVFICERCVGVHRQLGTHISMPRSCTIDDWNAEQLSAMKAVGNLNAQCYWEYNVPFGEQKPESTDPMAFVAHWIKRKYESQEFLRRPGGPEQNAPLDPGVRAYERKGYLLKEGGGSGKGRWQQRFFLLRDFKLEYYDKEPSNAGEKSVPKGIIPITPTTRVSISADRSTSQDVILDGVAFEVTNNDGRTFLIRGETTDEICGWVKCIRGVRAYSANDEVREQQKTLRHGYMIKKGKGGFAKGGDKIRWIVLKGNGEMIYYKDNKNTHPQNRFYLEPGSVSIDRSSDPPPGGAPGQYFMIRFNIRSQARTWELGVETEEVRRQWMASLQPWCR